MISRGRLAARASAAVLPCVLSAKVAALGLQHLMALQWLSRGDMLLHAVADEASSAHLAAAIGRGIATLYWNSLLYHTGE